MGALLEELMLCSFVAADLVWLVQIWKTTRTFARSEKIRSVAFTAAFLLGFFGWRWENMCSARYSA